MKGPKIAQKKSHEKGAKLGKKGAKEKFLVLNLEGQSCDNVAAVT